MTSEKAKEFGSYLKELRLAASLSLRGAEAKSGKEVSNAYISQLESGKILKPSPHILNKLAHVYGVPNSKLMEEAGYIKPTKGKRGGFAFLDKHGVSPEERAELIKYLEFIRSRKG